MLNESMNELAKLNRYYDWCDKHNACLTIGCYYHAVEDLSYCGHCLYCCGTLPNERISQKKQLENDIAASSHS